LASCLIVASGPSLKKTDLDLCGSVFDFTIAINDNYQVCSEADIIYACDHAWWKHHLPQVASHPGRKITPFAHTAKAFSLEHYPASHGIFHPDRIAFGNNSGHQAITLAVLLGFDHIYLLGYDCSVTSDKTHWFGDHPRSLYVKSAYEHWRQDFASLNLIPKDKGISVINLSRETTLDFDRMDLESCIRQCRTTTGS